MQDETSLEQLASTNTIDTVIGSFGIVRNIVCGKLSKYVIEDSSALVFDHRSSIMFPVSDVGDL